jgi:hypothetical protein
MSGYLKALTPFLFAAGLASAANAQVVTSSQWAAVNDNGGLGGSFVFLNSGGANPFSSGSAWTTSWTPTDVVYSATFGSGTVTNSSGWNGSSFIYSFGFPDTTTYGETFIAPSSSISAFNFDILNAGVGTQAIFVLATWDSLNSRAVSPLFTSAANVAVTGGYSWVNNSISGVTLTPGETYVAFLTVAAAPEPSTWAMMLAGFAGLGFAGLRRARKAQSIA